MPKRNFGLSYDADFVSSLRAADAAPPEASFDNVVDMLDWLNRDDRELLSLYSRDAQVAAYCCLVFAWLGCLGFGLALLIASRL